MIKQLIESGTPLFTVHRWKAYQTDKTIVMLAFNGTLGYNREDSRGWRHEYTVSSLSEAVETLIHVYTGL